MGQGSCCCLATFTIATSVSMIIDLIGWLFAASPSTSTGTSGSARGTSASSSGSLGAWGARVGITPFDLRLRLLLLQFFLISFLSRGGVVVGLIFST